MLATLARRVTDPDRIRAAQLGPCRLEWWPVGGPRRLAVLPATSNRHTYRRTLSIPHLGLVTLRVRRAAAA